MNIVRNIRKNIAEIKDMLLYIYDGQFICSLDSLSGATIGQHVRHILEFYLCLFENGDTICYDDRKRDGRIEADRIFALQTIDRILMELQSLGVDRALSLRGNYSAASNDNVHLSTSLYRELAYTLEHSIHHQALIKVGITQLHAEHALSDNFGLAPATIRYRNG
jgi:uncharacterized damage-inducible protein DinB